MLQIYPNLTALKIISKEIALELNPDALLMTERTAKWLENNKFESINLLLKTGISKELKYSIMFNEIYKNYRILENLYYE